LESTGGIHRCSWHATTIRKIDHDRFVVISAAALTQPLGLLDSWLEGWSIALRGAGDCFQAALTRGPGALNLPRWLELTMERTPPAWTTPPRD
jgi:hypothetical protein